MCIYLIKLYAMKAYGKVVVEIQAYTNLWFTLQENVFNSLFSYILLSITGGRNALYFVTS
jgi:hypothetical protein